MKTKGHTDAKVLIETGGRQTGKTTRQIDWLIGQSRDSEYQDCLLIAPSYMTAHCFVERFEEKTGVELPFIVMPKVMDAMILGISPNTKAAFCNADLFLSLERVMNCVNEHKEIEKATIEWL